jgi:hypothetical protein
VLRITTGVRDGEPVCTGLVAEAQTGCDPVTVDEVTSAVRIRPLVRALAAATAWRVHRGDGYVAYSLANDVPSDENVLSYSDVLTQLTPRRGRPPGSGIDRARILAQLAAAELDLTSSPTEIAKIVKVPRSTVYRLRREFGIPSPRAGQ